MYRIVKVGDSMNKKGFTLIELLAAVVIVSILILLAIPGVERSINLARRKSFVKDARTIVSVVKNDAVSVNSHADYSYNGLIYLYHKENINNSLDKKLNKSPFGTQYKDAGVLIRKNADGTYENYVCLVDNNGYGFNYTKVSDLTANSVIIDKSITCDKDFGSYTVELEVINGKPEHDSANVIEDEKAEFNVVPNSGFGKTPPDIICDNGEVATYFNNTVTTSGIKHDTKCVVTFRPNSNKPDCPAPSSVNISHEGVITWVNSNGVNGYQISTDGTTWTTATNGMNYFNQLVASTGSKVIYLRSECDAAQYNTPSAIISTPVDVYTVSVSVENGSVNTASKKVISGDNAAFTISATNADCSNAPIVSCTNQQSAAISGSSLTVGPVTNDTVCTVKYPIKTYLVTYGKGSYSSATGMPASQTKQCGVDLTLTSAAPTGNENNTFLGWATKASATASSGTWYDGGTVYKANANLNLYAQWYDVTSLENSYTKYVQYNDFKQESVEVSNITYTGGNGLSISTTKPSLDGYTYKTLSGYILYYTQRPYKMLVNSTSYRSMANVPASSPVTNTKYYLMIKNRSSSTYNSDSIDKRIDRLQKLYDVTLTRSEIIPWTYEKDNLTLSASKRYLTQTFDPKDGYKFIGTVGYSVMASTSNSNDSQIVYCYRLNATSNTTTMGVALSYDTNTKFRIYARTLQVKQKSKRTTTFSPTEKSTKGLSRYVALTALDSAKSKRFLASHIKTKTFTSSPYTNTGWRYSAGFIGDLTLPSGKMFGLSTYRAYNGSGGSGESFASFNDAAVKWEGDTHGQFYLEARAGNSLLSDSAGHSFTKVILEGTVLYLSSDTISMKVIS